MNRNMSKLVRGGASGSGLEHGRAAQLCRLLRPGVEAGYDREVSAEHAHHNNRDGLVPSIKYATPWPASLNECETGKKG